MEFLLRSLKTALPPPPLPPLPPTYPQCLPLCCVCLRLTIKACCRSLSVGFFLLPFCFHNLHPSVSSVHTSASVSHHLCACRLEACRRGSEDSFLLSVAAEQVTPFRGSDPTENIWRRGAFAGEVSDGAASDCSARSI